ncbi:MAG: hypothetical protein CMJ83_08250 [Planctomycetes bacterium]|nr:hypothetical protein [Planctomycetota bacterium]
MSPTTDKLLERGEGLFMNDEFEAAARCFEQAVAADAACGRAWNDLGAARHALGDEPGALTAFGRAVEIAPDDTDAVINLTQLLMAGDRSQQAPPHLRRALAAHPDHDELRALLDQLGVEGPQHPAAVLLDWDRTLRRHRVLLRHVLEQTGYRPWSIGRDLVEALAGAWECPVVDAAARIIDSLPTGIVVVEDGVGETSGLRDHARTRGIPTLEITPGPRPTEDRVIDATLEPEPFVEALLSTISALIPPVSTAPCIDVDPLLSIVIPTYCREVCLRNLLDRIALQDLPPALFEVLVVDDGSPTPVTEWLDASCVPYSLHLDWQENAGPATARNRAIARARAPYLLILNDDAVPARDNFRRHLVGQLGTDQPTTILGSFDFDARACEDPFTDLMQHSTLLFEYLAMKAGGTYGWRFFYTCNLSLPKASVDAVGGFDESFRHAICEDTELGVRLDDAGVPLLYDPRIRSWHDHDMDHQRYRRRSALLGHYRLHFVDRHPHMAGRFLGGEREGFNRDAWLLIRLKTEEIAPEIPDLLLDLKAAEERARAWPAGAPERKAELLAMTKVVDRVGIHDWLRGMLDTRFGAAQPATPRPAPIDAKTTIIIPNLNGFPHVKDCLDTLRTHTDGPLQTVIIDNGSNDGSLEWLRTQHDIQLLEMGTNIGAPAARNAGLQIAEGETIVFSDNDVLFTPKWRELLIGHLGTWPDIGIVGPMSDYVSGPQKTHEGEQHGEDLDAFARRFTDAHRGRGNYASRLILFFMMCRRDVIEKIGGIDPIYGRWGFEDDDYSLRTLAAGFELRIAQDCFIRHLGSRTSKTANIDYGSLLRENWEVFKRKWRLPQHLAYGEPWTVSTVLNRPFNRAEHWVPLDAGLPAAAAT